MAGAAGLHCVLSLTVPLRTATSSRSTVMPGLVSRVSVPLRTSAAISIDGWVMTASVKSSRAEPLLTRTSIRRGTTHRPVRSA